MSVALDSWAVSVYTVRTPTGTPGGGDSGQREADTDGNEPLGRVPGLPDVQHSVAVWRPGLSPLRGGYGGDVSSLGRGSAGRPWPGDSRGGRAPGLAPAATGPSGPFGEEGEGDQPRIPNAGRRDPGDCRGPDSLLSPQRAGRRRRNAPRPPALLPSASCSKTCFAMRTGTWCTRMTFRICSSGARTPSPPASFPSCRRGCCCRTSPAYPPWWTWRRCAPPWPAWAATQRRSTPWYPPTWSSTTRCRWTTSDPRRPCG